MKPQVVTWFKVYAGLMVVIYLAVAGFGCVFLAKPDIFIDETGSGHRNAPGGEAEAIIMGVMYLGLGVLFAGAFVVSLFSPRRFWAWVYNLVLICLGLTSCCFWPITIPLLIFWIKEETRAWYKNDPAAGGV